MDENATYYCPHCGAPVEIMVDITGGPRQQYVEDCHVCCAPNVLTVVFDEDGRVAVTADPE